MNNKQVFKFEQQGSVIKVNKRTKNIIYFLVLLIATILMGCNNHDIEGDKVYYVDWNEASGKNKTLIEGADAKTFKELEYAKYAIDKNYVYYEAGRLKDANPKTFTAILDYYGKDDKFAYKGNDKIDGANGQSFAVIEGGPYSRDNKDYYFDTISLNVSDLKTFQILSQISDYGYWAKDKNYYYLSGERYPLADYQTFDKIGNGYAKDKFQVYFEDSVVTGADAATFKTIEYAYAQDKNSRFSGARRLTIKDPNSFEVLNLGFSKDKFYVYRNDSIVENADPKTFLIINWMWSKDKKSFFYQGKMIPYIDYATFQYLDYNYAVDKNNVYYNEQIIKGADAKTFKHLDGSQDGRDKNGCYRYGEKVDCNVLLTD